MQAHSYRTRRNTLCLTLTARPCHPASGGIGPTLPPDCLTQPTTSTNTSTNLVPLPNSWNDVLVCETSTQLSVFLCPPPPAGFEAGFGGQRNLNRKNLDSTTLRRRLIVPLDMNSQKMKCLSLYKNHILSPAARGIVEDTLSTPSHDITLVPYFPHDYHMHLHVSDTFI
jgi:hypothetical protein